MGLKQLLKDPTTIWFIYGLAALLILDGVVLRIISRRRSVRASGRAVVVEGDNPRIVVAGKAGNINQQRLNDGGMGENPEHRSGAASRALGIAANVLTIFSFLLAVLGFYLAHRG